MDNRTCILTECKDKENVDNIGNVITVTLKPAS